MSLRLRLVTTDPHCAYQVIIDLEATTVEFCERGQIVFFWIAKRSDTHHFKLAVECLEAEVIGQRRIHSRQGIGVVKFLHANYFPGLGIT